MMKIFLVLSGFVLLLSACSPAINITDPPVVDSPQFCVRDDDCVCGGIDRRTSDCFVGSRKYYNSGSVDQEKSCPDFCTGIAANIVTKCVENKCMNVNKNTFPECSVDSDCVPVGGCHPSSCVSKEKAQKNDEPVFCTQNCVPGSLDCGGSCACESRRCVTKNLFVQKDDVPVV